MADLVTVKIRDLIESQEVLTTDYLVLEKTTGTFKCQARYLKGATGVTPNVTVGTTTTLSPGQDALVTKRGNLENPIFDFSIPRGNVGPQGPKGDTPDITPLKTEIDNRFNALTSQQQGDSEVIDARGGYPALKARLDNINNDLIKYNEQTIVTHTTEINFSSIDATKNGYLDNILLEGKTLLVDSNNNIVLPGTQGATIKSVGDGVDIIKLKSLGSNLIDIEGFKFGESKRVFLSKGNYVFSTIVKTQTSARCGVVIRDKDGVPIANKPSEIGVTKLNFTLPIDGYVDISFGVWDTGCIFESATSNMLNYGYDYIPYNKYKENYKKVLYKDTDGTWKKPILKQWDSIEKHNDGKYYYHKRGDIRSYQSGDESNSNVITDRINTVYKLNNEFAYECTPIDLISYENQTNYIIECGPIYPKTTLKVNSYLGNVVSILKEKVSNIEDMLRMVLSGNMQSLAYSLYPQDFVNNVDKEVSV